MNDLTHANTAALSFLSRLTTQSGKPLVYSNENGEPITTSWLVAEFFEKEHKNVMRVISEIKDEVAQTYEDMTNVEHGLNFEPMFIDVGVGQGGTRKTQGYTLNEEEFALVAMSFTGKKAMQFKIAYVKAFSLMRTALLSNLRLQNQKMQAMLPDMERMAELERRVATLTSPFLKHNTPNALHKFADNRAEAAAAAERAKVKAKNEADVARHKRDKTKDNLRLALICAADYRDLLEKVLGAKVIPTTAGNEFLRLQMAHTALTNAHIGLRPVDDYGFRRINADVLARMARYAGRGRRSVRFVGLSVLLHRTVEQNLIRQIRANQVR